jgi:hypothetical protein
MSIVIMKRAVVTFATRSRGVTRSFATTARRRRQRKANWYRLRRAEERWRQQRAGAAEGKPVTPAQQDDLPFGAFGGWKPFFIVATAPLVMWSLLFTFRPDSREAVLKELQWIQEVIGWSVDEDDSAQNNGKHVKENLRPK